MSTSTLNRLDPTQVELEIPITPEELAAAQERAFRRLAKNVKLPGFRAGKVPRKVFEQTYGTEAIASEALEDVVPEVYARAVREHESLPVARPKMELLPAEEGQAFALKATVAVRPAIELSNYKGIEVEREAPAIDDDDVERSIAALAKERATLVPVERPAQLGDVATLDYEGKIDGVAFEGGTAKGQMTELDENRFIPGFASGIAGMSAGETKDVEAVFPIRLSEGRSGRKDRRVYGHRSRRESSPSFPRSTTSSPRRFRRTRRSTRCAPTYASVSTQSQNRARGGPSATR